MRRSRARVQVVAHAVLEHAHVDPRIGLRHADALGEQPESLRREAATARADERRHARIVPAVDVSVLDELEQLALRQHDVREVEPRELVLLRQRPRQAPPSASCSITQSYSGRWSWNSSVQIECVMRSSASEMQCV